MAFVTFVSIQFVLGAWSAVPAKAVLAMPDLCTDMMCLQRAFSKCSVSLDAGGCCSLVWG